MTLYKIVQEKYKSPELLISDNDGNFNTKGINLYNLFPTLTKEQFKSFKYNLLDMNSSQLKQLINIGKYQYIEKININNITQYRRTKKNILRFTELYIHKLVLEGLQK